MRKPTICIICETKGADQRLCIRYTDSIIPLRFQSLAIFYVCTAWFVSNLLKKRIVGSLTRRLISSDGCLNGVRG